MYAISNPKDGEEPVYRALRAGEAPAAGEVAVKDVPAGSVWDATSKRLRPKTDAERLAEEEQEKTEDGLAASAAATLRASTNPDTRALVVVLERAGVL